MTEKIVVFLLLLMNFSNVGVSGGAATVTSNGIFNAMINRDEVMSAEEVTKTDEILFRRIGMATDVVNDKTVKFGIKSRAKIAIRVTVEEGVRQTDATVIFGIMTTPKKPVTIEEMDAHATNKRLNFADVMKIAEN